jgi:hypothetical protein
MERTAKTWLSATAYPSHPSGKFGSILFLIDSLISALLLGGTIDFGHCGAVRCSPVIGVDSRYSIPLFILCNFNFSAYYVPGFRLRPFGCQKNWLQFENGILNS